MRFKINRFLINDIEDKDHPSNFDYTKEYSVLVLRLPYITQNKIEVYSYVFYIPKDGKIYKFKRSINDFEYLGSFDKLYEYLYVRIDKILAKASKLQFQIEKLEDNLYENNFNNNFPSQWLSYKKDLSLIQRLLEHAMLAFARFIKYHKNEINELEFNDLYEHMEHALRLASSGIAKLDNLYNFYRAKTDEKMNHIMFVLTIISAIFMPLTLVTGFFGMNTGGLPLTEDPNGTIKVSLAVIVFEIPFVFYIWKMMKRA